MYRGLAVNLHRPLLGVGQLGEKPRVAPRVPDSTRAFAVVVVGHRIRRCAAFIERSSWNSQYYDAFAPSRSIVIDRKFYNGHADPLRSLLP